MQEERRQMQQELEAVTAQAEETQAAVTQMQGEKQLLQRQLTLSVDTNERLKVDLDTQYVFYPTRVQRTACSPCSLRVLDYCMIYNTLAPQYVYRHLPYLTHHSFC